MAIVLMLLILWNIAVSFWNARVAGLAWGDRSASYGGFLNLVLWSAVIQSAVGFSMPILLAEAMIFKATGNLSDAAMKAMFGLWYLAIIVPALGTGLIITAHSLVEAYRSRNWGDMAVAGYNTAASIHNVYEASSGIGEAASAVGDLFKSDHEDNNGPVIMIVISLVALSIAGGVLIAWGIVQHYKRKAPSFVLACTEPK